MKRFVPLIMMSALLASCAVAVQEPAQPTNTSATTALSQIVNVTMPDGSAPTGAQVWAADSWAIKMACDAYLDGGAKRFNQLTTAEGLTSFAGVGAMALGANPLAGGAAALATGLLNTLQTSGVQYSPEDTLLIRQTMAADAQSVAASPPQDVPSALNDAEDYWYRCSVAGVAETEAVTKTTTVVSPNITVASPSFRALVLPAPPPGVLVNGHPL